MILRRIQPVSCAKVSGLVYALVGLLMGGLFALISLAGAGFGAMMSDAGATWMSTFFGVGALVAFPLFYGVMGFIGGLITALIYNGAAHVAGGIEVELE